MHTARMPSLLESSSRIGRNGNGEGMVYVTRFPWQRAPAGGGAAEHELILETSMFRH